MAHNEKVVEIDLREISPGLAGIRSGDWTATRETTWEGWNVEQSQFVDLVNSIEKLGQLEPGIVRENQSDSRHAWELVVGFRRYAALRMLWESDGIKDCTFRAVVRELDDRQALETMIASNMRASVDPSDLAFALDRYVKLWHEKHPNTSDSQAIERLGIDRGFALTLMRVVRLGRGIAKRWQQASERLPLQNMLTLITIEGEEKQIKAYESALQYQQGYPDSTAEELRLSSIAEELRTIAEKLDEMPLNAAKSSTLIEEG